MRGSEQWVCRLLWIAFGLGCGVDGRAGLAVVDPAGGAGGVLAEGASEGVARVGGADGAARSSDGEGADAAGGEAVMAPGAGVAGSAPVDMAGAGGGAAVNAGGGGEASGASAGGAGADEPACVGGAASCSGSGDRVLLTPVDGWVDVQTNDVAVQGAFFFASDAEGGGPSWIEVVDAGPNICARGVAGPVANTGAGPEYARDWGVLIGLELAQPAPGLASGPWSQQTPVGTLAGFSFSLTGSQIPAQALRFTVTTSAGARHCVPLTGASGRFSIPASQLAIECWAPDGATLTSAVALTRIDWTVNTTLEAPVPFDFCVEELAVEVQ